MTLLMRDQENIEKGMERGRKEGKIEGRAVEIIDMGYEFGLSKDVIIKKLQDKLNISLQEAQKYLDMFGKKS